MSPEFRIGLDFGDVVHLPDGYTDPDVRIMNLTWDLFVITHPEHPPLFWNARDRALYCAVIPRPFDFTDWYLHTWP